LSKCVLIFLRIKENTASNSKSNKKYKSSVYNSIKDITVLLELRISPSIHILSIFFKVAISIFKKFPVQLKALKIRNKNHLFAQSLLILLSKNIFIRILYGKWLFLMGLSYSVHCNIKINSKFL
jgi:hypothetical protein